MIFTERESRLPSHLYIESHDAFPSVFTADNCAIIVEMKMPDDAWQQRIITDPYLINPLKRHVSDMASEFRVYLMMGSGSNYGAHENCSLQRIEKIHYIEGNNPDTSSGIEKIFGHAYRTTSGRTIVRANVHPDAVPSEYRDGGVLIYDADE